MTRCASSSSAWGSCRPSTEAPMGSSLAEGTSRSCTTRARICWRAPGRSRRRIFSSRGSQTARGTQRRSLPSSGASMASSGGSRNWLSTSGCCHRPPCRLRPPCRNLLRRLCRHCLRHRHGARRPRRRLSRRRPHHRLHRLRRCRRGIWRHQAPSRATTATMWLWQTARLPSRASQQPLARRPGGRWRSARAVPAYTTRAGAQCHTCARRRQSLAAAAGPRTTSTPPPPAREPHGSTMRGSGLLTSASASLCHRRFHPRRPPLCHHPPRRRRRHRHLGYLRRRHRCLRHHRPRRRPSRPPSRHCTRAALTRADMGHALTFAACSLANRPHCSEQAAALSCAIATAPAAAQTTRLCLHCRLPRPHRNHHPHQHLRCLHLSIRRPPHHGPSRRAQRCHQPGHHPRLTGRSRQISRSRQTSRRRCCRRRPSRRRRHHHLLHHPRCPHPHRHSRPECRRVLLRRRCRRHPLHRHRRHRCRHRHGGSRKTVHQEARLAGRTKGAPSA